MVCLSKLKHLVQFFLAHFKCQITEVLLVLGNYTHFLYLMIIDSNYFNDI